MTRWVNDLKPFKCPLCFRVVQQFPNHITTTHNLIPNKRLLIERAYRGEYSV